MLEAHSKFSASKSKQWLNCPGSMVLTANLTDTTSKYAEEGTRAHKAAEAVLRGEVPVFDDADMQGHVATYVDNIKQYAEGGELMVEQKLNYAKYLGLPEAAAWGTSDAVIIKGDEIQVADLKYGMGEVVSPESNPQMMLYALGALAAFDDLAGPFKRVRMVIHQPRVVKAPQEWDCSVEELLAFGEEAKRAVHLVKAAEHGAGSIAQGTKTQAEWEAEYLKPGADQCRWCKAKATCPKLRAEVLDTVFATVPATAEDFADLSVPGPAHIAPTDDDWLAAAGEKTDQIEDWVKAIRAELERRLFARNNSLEAQQALRQKLVQGKQGNRAWADTAKAEALLKSFRLKVEDMYDMKVISPTSAEKVLAESPKRWAKAQELITRADGKLSVAPLSDKRPAVTVKPVAEDFTDLSVADDLG